MSPRGGKRAGAGRPRGEPTKAVRISLSQLAELEQLKNRKIYQLPVFASKIQAGFPSPADDYIEGYLDLNTKFIKHPSATFVLQATGDSMVDAGIFSGDWLLVDRSIEPSDGRIVIAAVNGELTVKRLSKTRGRVQLLPANPKFNPIDITEEDEMVIWGVVTLVLHELA
ncbi:DNA polymerase V [Legionella qingyii]|uniref:DNA polymerase V n=1 Tax=Legionella qingyii TaxID=2184757 RepID=A0A317U708_9GAMM|nr:translesion error-prone DNA polymerase V autoproteolytic subunit [Legionella qingyii]PWY56527.1 DNA polymerase V [Legionella qingyii]PWY57116.1 DNA polymerase V [Legionella qingyii]RUR25044.1 translesion error-prone DNA polymerase V autoproteolytic subunit [Legionella qingyii]RUR28684.1 translesion error-prone DNA polymerase V autoproteolytic subunit [Legionella qingyii]